MSRSTLRIHGPLITFPKCAPGRKIRYHDDFYDVKVQIIVEMIEDDTIRQPVIASGSSAERALQAKSQISQRLKVDVLHANDSIFRISRRTSVWYIPLLRPD